MIKNIVFDLGNVILKGKSQGVLDKLDLNDLEKEIISNTFFHDWNDLDLGKKNLYEKYMEANIPLNLTDEAKDKLLNYYRYRDFNDQLLEIIKILKENNYKVYILSNNNHQVYIYLKSLPIFNNIDGWVVSSEYQTMKPDKTIYQILFNKFNLKPNECFFIDDKFENVEAGLNLGMKGLVFDYENDGINKLLEEFEKNNIIINYDYLKNNENI